ncbi:unnamed protein product, partial [marine sediment metagenome]
LDNGSLIKIGGDADESRLMFAKFSPDGSQVAYVYYNNIYIQRLSDMKIHQITKAGSDIIINGTSDWVYEEEFGLRDGFRWSPDGRFIAYWQFDTSDVKEFKLINYIDGLYPTITSYKYPKVGQTINRSGCLRIMPNCRNALMRCLAIRVSFLRSTLETVLFLTPGL